MRKRIISTFASLLLLLSATIVPVGAVDKDNDRNKHRLEGTWLVTATFTDPTGIDPFKVLFTFAPGRNDDEGTLIDTNEFQLTPNPVCSPDQGVWERTGNREFIATHFNFCFDALNMYVPAGPTKIRDVINLSRDGETLRMRQYIEGYDTDGNLVFTGTVAATGVRIHAEAPPSN